MKRYLAISLILCSASAFAQGRYSASYRAYHEKWLHDERARFETEFSFSYWYRSVPPYNECSSFHNVIESMDREVRDYDRAYRNPVQKRRDNAASALEYLNARIGRLKERDGNKKDRIAKLRYKITQLDNGKKPDPDGSVKQAALDQIADLTQQINDNRADIAEAEDEKPAYLTQKQEALTELAQLDQRYSQLRLYLATLIDSHFLCHDYFCQQAANDAGQKEILKLETSKCKGGSDITVFTGSCEYEGIVQARNLICPGGKETN